MKYNAFECSILLFIFLIVLKSVKLCKVYIVSALSKSTLTYGMAVYVCGLMHHKPFLGYHIKLIIC